MRLNRKSIYEINIWPGFVDILGTLLIVTIFTVLISTVTQIYFNDQLEVKRGEISSLDEELNSLIKQLEIESKEKKKLKKKVANLGKSIELLEKEKLSITSNLGNLEEDLTKKKYLLKIKDKEINVLVNEKSDILDDLQEKNTKLAGLKEENKKALLEIYELNRNVEKLNKRIEDLSKLLLTSEEKDKKNKIKIENLGKRLNQALAGKVQELSEYQSIFFKRIMEAIGDREDIRVKGDRFIFPSEIFFQSGSDILELEGLAKLENVAKSLKEISKKIPKKIDWILRIDGHTDKIPINNKKFTSNWHLSSSRSINIVKFLIEQGIPPKRLVAAGFGEYSPLVNEQSEEAFKKNRRIEVKLTTR
ncbi:MAG: Motility protein B [Alphaproteobacteria bacterium MarineAlpha8_Bin1]|nr:MAG: Motility protein B [Alphaproteobacteria bacterium MarineAlpha8_Bin1]